MPSPLPFKSEWPTSSMLRLSRIFMELTPLAQRQSFPLSRRRRREGLAKLRCRRSSLDGGKTERLSRDGDLVNRKGGQFALPVLGHGKGTGEEDAERPLGVDGGDLDGEGHAGDDVHFEGLTSHFVNRDVRRRGDQVQAVSDDGPRLSALLAKVRASPAHVFEGLAGLEFGPDSLEA